MTIKTTGYLVDIAIVFGWAAVTAGLATTWRGYAIGGGALLIAWALVKTIEVAVKGGGEETGGEG